MKTLVNKRNEHSRSSADRQNNPTHAAQAGITDNRPTAIAQRKLNSEVTKSVGKEQPQAHNKGCGCGSCGTTSQTLAPVSAPQSIQLKAVAQLTCNAGHKQHPNGPCPSSPEGRVARMAGTHHAKTGVRGTPKKRREKWAAQNLSSAQSRMGPPPPPPPPPPATA